MARKKYLVPEVEAGEFANKRKRSAVYLRVSTSKQYKKDITPDGFSLPTQEEACARRSEELSADVVVIYKDRGESAKSADRPDFQRMLHRIRTDRDIDYVIVYKIDRANRNVIEELQMADEIRAAGAVYVSVSEHIDDTPAGRMSHVLHAAVAEYHSRNSGAGAIRGMTKKAQLGGTPGRAPIGYRNVTEKLSSGGEIKTVIVDPERAPLVQWAFDTYSGGDWSLTRLTETLQAKGLRALPHGGEVPGLIQRSHVASMLTNRYYLGYVPFNGSEYQGRHQPLVPSVLFERVQEVLRARRHAADRPSKHPHFLIGSIFCARCGARLCFSRTTGQGGIYDYFFCIGRQQRRTDCKQPYVPVGAVEDAIAEYYETIRIPDELRADVVKGIRKELAYQRKQAGPEIAFAKRRVVELDNERRRLARGVVDGSIPGDLARPEHERIDEEWAAAQRLLAAAERVFGHVEETLTLAMALVGRCDEVYRRGGPRIKRLMNQFFFAKLLVVDTKVAGTVYAEPLGALLADDFIKKMRRRAKSDREMSAKDSGRRCTSTARALSNLASLARPAGLEPAAPGSGTQCSIH